MCIQRRSRITKQDIYLSVFFSLTIPCCSPFSISFQCILIFQVSFFDLYPFPSQTEAFLCTLHYFSTHFLSFRSPLEAGSFKETVIVAGTQQKGQSRTDVTHEIFHHIRMSQTSTERAWIFKVVVNQIVITPSLLHFFFTWSVTSH